MTVLLVVSFLFTSSEIYASNESRVRRRFWNVNCPRTSSHHFSVNSSYIHAFEELTTEHCRLYSSCNDFDSLFAAPNTINGFSLVPSNLAAKQTAKLGQLNFHWGIFSTGSFDSSFRNHIVPDSSFINIVRGKIILTLKSTCMHCKGY